MSISDEEKRQIMNELARGNPEMQAQEPANTLHRMRKTLIRRITKTLMTLLNAVLRPNKDNYLTSL